MDRPSVPTNWSRVRIVRVTLEQAVAESRQARAEAQRVIAEAQRLQRSLEALPAAVVADPPKPRSE